MSLQVWLPFIKGLTNQGISSLSSITLASGNSLTANGKLGGQAITLTKLQTILPTLSSMTGAKEMSYAFWVKVNTAWEAQWLDGIRWISTDGSTTHTSRQEFYTNCTKVGTWFQGGSISGKDFTPGVWTHIAGTFNYNTGEVKFYLNGILQGTSTALATTHYCRGDFYIGDNGVDLSENDVRIYDHCLSDKEVEEIAKGLVLHYKLDDSYVENSNIINSIISDTAYNSSIGKYGYNETSNLGKIKGNFYGKDCVKVYTLTEGQTAQPYAYFSNLFTSNGTNAPAYKALSFDYLTTVPTTTWLNIYKLGSGSGIAVWKTINSNGTFTGTYTNSSNSIIVKPNEWNHIEIVFHGTTDANAEWGYCINGPAHTTNSQYYFLYANIQVEENDHVTGYGNNLHNNIVYDSSGYNNNGTIAGTLTVSENTSKYKYSTIFDGNTAAIQTPNLKTMITDKIYTISCWTYKTQIGSKNYQTIYGGPSGFELEARSSSTTNPLFRIHNWGGGTTPYEFGQWYHFCFVHTNDNSKLYINGELKITGTSVDIPSGNYFIGAWKTSSQQNYDGNISDFRIYATALTDEQILDLYHTSGTVDNKGNIYTRELVET